MELLTQLSKTLELIVNDDKSIILRCYVDDEELNCEISLTSEEANLMYKFLGDYHA